VNDVSFRAAAPWSAAFIALSITGTLLIVPENQSINGARLDPPGRRDWSG
jgi:hypothetical protein